MNTGGRYNPAANDWAGVTIAGAPSAVAGHTAVWTGTEMVVWGGYDDGDYLNDTFNYIPDCRVRDFTSIVRTGGNLTLSFPTLTGLTYTLWHSGTLTASSWTDTGLTPLPGTGAILTFTVPATTAARQFYRVQADP